jgi:hypothetical protein
MGGFFLAYESKRSAEMEYVYPSSGFIYSGVALTHLSGVSSASHIALRARLREALQP